LLPSHLVHARFLLGLISILKTEAIYSSETSVHIQTTWRYMPDDGKIRVKLFRYVLVLYRPVGRYCPVLVDFMHFIVQFLRINISLFIMF
jgi:hypothetical protein